MGLPLPHDSPPLRASKEFRLQSVKLTSLTWWDKWMALEMDDSPTASADTAAGVEQGHMQRGTKSKPLCSSGSSGSDVAAAAAAAAEQGRKRQRQERSMLPGTPLQLSCT